MRYTCGASAAVLFVTLALAHPADEPGYKTLALSGTATNQDVEDLATVLHQVADVTVQAPIVRESGALVVHGTDDQLAMAAWLAKQLNEDSSSGEHRFAGANNQLAQVFYLPADTKPQMMQEMITTLRAVGEMNHLFDYQWRAIALRGNPDEMRLAEWLIGNLPKPSAENPAFAATHGEQVRIFFVKNQLNPEERSALIHDVRTQALCNHIFGYTATRAIAVRGTADQIATAERVIGEEDKQAAQ